MSAAPPLARPPQARQRTARRYARAGGGLSEVLVRGAGHLAAQDAPAPVQALVARWTHAQPLAAPAPLLSAAFLRELVRNQSGLPYL